MSQALVKYKNNTPVWAPSGNIWYANGFDELRQDPSVGFYFEDSGPTRPYYVGGDLTGMDNQRLHPWNVGILTPASGNVGAVKGGDEVGGSWVLSTDDADNSVVNAQADFAGGFKFLSGITKGKICFEARIKVSAVDTSCGFFVGLASPGLHATSTGILGATSAPAAAKDFIGFHKTEADANLDFIYQAASQTLQIKIDALQVLVADTFYSVGFVFDPQADADKAITVYLGNTAQSTYVTKTNIAAATFPEDVLLTPTMSIVAATTAAKILEEKFLRCAQWQKAV